MTEKRLRLIQHGTKLIYKGAGLHFSCTFNGIIGHLVLIKVTENIGKPNRTLPIGYEASVGNYDNLHLAITEMPNEFIAKNGQIIRTKITHVF